MKMEDGCGELELAYDNNNTMKKMMMIIMAAVTAAITETYSCYCRLDAAAAVVVFHPFDC